jgi:hypothetical protein
MGVAHANLSLCYMYLLLRRVLFPQATGPSHASFYSSLFMSRSLTSLVYANLRID